MKKSYRIWLAVLVVGLFLVFFGELAFDRTLNSALIRVLLQDKIGALLGLRFDYRSVQVSFIPLGVEFYGIEVRDKHERKFSAESARADLSWWSLFMGTPKVGTFRIDKPVIHIVQQATSKAKRADNGKKSVWHWPRLHNDKIERLSFSEPKVHLDLTSAKGSRHLLTFNGGELVLDFRHATKVLVEMELAGLNYRQDDKQRLQDLSLTAEGELGTQGFVLRLDRLRSNHIEQLQGELRGQTVVDTQQVMTAPLEVRGTFDLQGDLALLTALLNISRSSGRSEAAFTIDMRFAPGTAVAFEAMGRAKVKQGVLGGIKVHDSEAHLTVTPQQIVFADGKLAVAGETRGSFYGKVGFKSPLVFDFGGSITRLTFAELMATFNTKLMLFDFNIAAQKVRVHGQGKPFALKVQGNTELTALQIYRQRNHRPPPVCAMHLDLHSNRERLQFKRLQGSCTKKGQDSGPLSMQGTIGYGKRGLDLRVAAPSFNLAAADFLLPDELQGRGKVGVTIRGAGDAVVVNSKLDLQRVRLPTGEVGNIAGNLDFHRNFVTWKNVKLVARQGGEVFSPQGRLTYTDLRFDTQLQARGVKAAAVEHLLRRVNAPLLFGAERLTARLSGFLPYPLAYRGEVRARLSALQAAKGEKLGDVLSFAAQTGKHGWQVTLHRWQHGALLLRGDIAHRRRVVFQREKSAAASHWLERLGMSRRDGLKVQLSAAQEREEAQHLPYLGKRFAARFTAFEFKLAGAVRRLRGTVRAQVNAVTLAGLQFNQLHVDGDVDGGKVAVHVRDEQRSVQGQVQVDLAAKKLPFGWQLVFDAFDVRQLVGHSGDEHSYVRLSGRWDLEGRLLQWFAASGELVLDAVRVRHRLAVTREQAFLLELQEPRRILFKRGKLAVVGGKKISFYGGDTTVAVTLRADCTLRRPTLDLAGTIDTAILPHFLEEIDVATGFLRLEGELRWRGDEPRFSVQVERLSPLAISVAGLRPAFNDIDIKASYRRGVVVIEKLQGRKGEGMIVVQGEIHPRGKAQSFLQLDLRNAHFVHPVFGFKNTELHLDGDVTLRWRQLPLALAGTLTVSRASNFSDFDIRKVILASFGEKKYRAPSLAREAVANFDLNIFADRSLAIENRNMQAQLSARLRLRGSNIAPQLSGFVKVERGRFAYRRSFTVTQGMISFEGGQRINPRLDIKAYSEVAPYVVDLLISGTAAEPVGELAVTPSLREDGTAITKADILMLLSRGTLPDPDKALATTGSAGFSEVTNVLVGQFERPLEDLLKRSGQDVISRIFINTYASPEGVLYPKLTAPINLPWRDWDLSLQVDPYMWKLLTEYPIHDSITLSGSVSGRSRDDEEQVEKRESANDQAVDLKFRFSIP